MIMRRMYMSANAVERPYAKMPLSERAAAVLIGTHWEGKMG